MQQLEALTRDAVALANGHNTTPEQSAQAEDWLWGRLGIVLKKPPATATK